MSARHRLVPPPWAIVSTLFVAVLAACGAREPDGGDAFRVALLTPGPISDDGWNASAFEGLARIEAELGAGTRHVRMRSPSEFESALSGFSSRGFDLVFAHGFEFSEAVLAVAPAATETFFVITSGVATAKNVASIRFGIEGPAWQAGRAAALLSRSGTLGVVGGVAIPPVESAFAAYEAGARSVRQDVRVRVVWIGGWDDVAAARQAALALCDEGADVLFHDADAAGLGVFNAAEERGVLAIGCNRDQNAVKPRTVIGSVVLDVPEAMIRLARDVRDRGHDALGRLHELDLESGVVRFAWNDALLAALGRDDEAALRAVAAAPPPADLGAPQQAR